MCKRTEQSQPTQRDNQCRRFGYRLTSQREGRVERCAPDDVSANAQPIRVEEGITGPTLQVCKPRREGSPWWDDWPRRGEPKEVTIVQLDLWYEKVVIRRQQERHREGDVKCHFRAGDWAVASSVLTGN